jgi:DNA-binding MarR family transcriptional regulator
MADGRERAHYRAETYRVEDSVGYLVTRLRASIFAAVDREVASWGISAAQGSILIYIAHGRGDRAAGSMTRMVERLVRKGLLERVRDDGDRRVVRLRLTRAGTAVTRRIPKVAAKVLNRHLRGFSAAEFRQLKGLLQRMLTNAGADHD